MLLEAYSDGGVLIGLPRTKAIQIAAMTMMVCTIQKVTNSAQSYIFYSPTFQGTAKMVLETGKHPGEVIGLYTVIYRLSVLSLTA